jgi:hypothetical protein
VVTALFGFSPLAASSAAVCVQATTTVSANSTAGQRTLTQVDFYANGAWIGGDTSAPYAFSWSGVGTGSYALTARATDSFGAQATSSGVTVVVGQPPPSTVLGMTITPEPPGAGQTHTWAAPGHYTVLARGYVSCGGEVTKGVTIGSAPMPDALDGAALASAVAQLAVGVEAEAMRDASACRGPSCGFRLQAEEPPSIRHGNDPWGESAFTVRPCGSRMRRVRCRVRADGGCHRVRRRGADVDVPGR